jgi:hypothetical protein
MFLPQVIVDVLPTLSKYYKVRETCELCMQQQHSPKKCHYSDIKIDSADVQGYVLTSMR